MSKADIDRHLTQVERRCMKVLQELERARLNIKPISREYERMRNGESLVGGALANAREMLDDIIGLTPPKIQGQIKPPVHGVI